MLRGKRKEDQTRKCMYKVNEIFHSLQGEGRWTGKAAVFVRLSGCNLKCDFCDTDHSGHQEMEAGEIVQSIAKLSPKSRFVILTGGEPALQVDKELIQALHEKSYYVAMETNGTIPILPEIDWVTCSPKQAFVPGKGNIRILHADELKVVFDGEHDVDDYGIQCAYKYLQPCDTGDANRNAKILKACIEYIKANPEWQLSLQTHKLIGIR